MSATQGSLRAVLQGTGFMLYIPSDNILPNGMTAFYLTSDCVVSLTDLNDHNEDGVPFKAGYQPLLVKKIRAVSAGSVYLITNNNVA